MHRVFAHSKDINTDEKTIRIYGDDAYHLSKVLRIKKGDSIIICDMNKTDFLCEALDISADTVIFNILRSYENLVEKSYKTTLCQAMTKGNKIELVLQKAVELGVDGVIIFYSSRCDVKYEKQKEDKKLSRYKKIIYEAAKQCGRGIIPEIKIKKTFDDMLQSIDDKSDTIMAYEEERHTMLKQVLSNVSDDIAFIVGPEGGFDENEVSYAKKSGVNIVSLGRRILRTETAGMFILSCCVYEKELIGK